MAGDDATDGRGRTGESESEGSGNDDGDHAADGDAGHDHDSHDDHGGHEEHDDNGGQEHDTHDDHDHHHHDVDTLGVGVMTVSSTRSLDDDPAGDAIATAFESAGHEVAVRDLVRDDYDGVQSAVDANVGRDDVDVVVTTGGTGVTPDDVTVEAVEPLLEKRLPGFGELFRRYSVDEIGTRVVATRAVAGVADGVPVFCLPGSENATRLGAEEIIVPEAPHLAGLATRD
jgi:molybdenum cofactor biosynthesis protein B